MKSVAALGPILAGWSSLNGFNGKHGSPSKWARGGPQPRHLLDLSRSPFAGLAHGTNGSNFGRRTASQKSHYPSQTSGRLHNLEASIPSRLKHAPLSSNRKSGFPNFSLDSVGSSPAQKALIRKITSARELSLEARTQLLGSNKNAPKLQDFAKRVDEQLSSLREELEQQKLDEGMKRQGAILARNDLPEMRRELTLVRQAVASLRTTELVLGNRRESTRSFLVGYELNLRGAIDNHPKSKQT